MAGGKRGEMGSAMSRGEIIGGVLYLPLYIIGLSWLLKLVWELLGFSPLGQFSDILYTLLNLLAVLLIFHRWLLTSLQTAARQFWTCLQAAVLGAAFYYAMLWVLSRLLGLLSWSMENPNNERIFSTLNGGYGWLVLLCAILPVPVVEETLFRGLIFSNLWGENRILAYAVSGLAFAAVHVWQFFSQLGWAGTLLCALQYLPAGIALGWTVEKSKTVWSAVLVHGFINAAALGVFG